MLRVTDCNIDPASIGTRNILTEIRPAYVYSNGERTNNIDGYRYTIAIPTLGFKKLSVKIEHQTPLFNLELEEIPMGTEVEFTGLEIGTYFSKGQVNLSAKAQSISIMGGNNVQPQKETK